MTKIRGPLTLKDVKSIEKDAWQMVQDPDVTKNFANFGKKISLKNERDYLRKIVTSKNERLYVIEDEEGMYCGQIGIHQIYWPAKIGRIGIMLTKSAWGKGHATRAIRQILSEAFTKHKLNKVWIIFYKTNKRMQHLSKKLGFVKEGVLLDEYFHKSKYHDMVRMCLFVL